MSQQTGPGSANDPDTNPASDDSKAGQEGLAEANEVEAEEKEPTIHLDKFLKTCGVATGGQAKVMIQAGEVLVNNEVETRRRKQLRVGDEVTLGDVVYVVALNE